jgi:hypothetical protein
LEAVLELNATPSFVPNKRAIWRNFCFGTACLNLLLRRYNPQEGEKVMAASSIERFGGATVTSPSMQMSAMASPVKASPFEPIQFPADFERLEEATAVTGGFARGVRWALGLEFGAALCIYGVWYLFHLH